jgi:hypothetical protein
MIYPTDILYSDFALQPQIDTEKIKMSSDFLIMMMTGISAVSSWKVIRGMTALLLIIHAEIPIALDYREGVRA